MARRNPIAQALAAGATLFAARLTRILPLAVSRALMIACGRIALRVVPRIRRVGIENLDRAYGDSLSQEEKLRILKGAVDNMAIVAAEFSRLPLFAGRRFEGLVTAEGLEHLDPARGCLCISGHIGNWEFMAPVLAAHGFKLAEVVRPLDAPALDRYVEGTREAGGIRTIPKDKAGKELLDLLKAGWIAGILMDQSPRTNGIPTTFFGQPCWSTIGPAMMAQRSQVPVCFVTLLRQPDHSYHLRVHPPLALEFTGSIRQDLLANTQRIQDAFEAIVRAQPDQWLWLHRRWKGRPRLEREWAERLQRDKAVVPAEGEEGSSTVKEL
jgi:KDO2-lipid IV(A) lauroyltransferase